MKPKTVLLAAFGILAALFIGLGAIFGEVSDSNGKSTMETGYYDANGYHVVSREEGYLGGSSKKEKTASTISTVCYVVGGLNAGIFVIVLFIKPKQDNQ